MSLYLYKVCTSPTNQNQCEEQMAHEGAENKHWTNKQQEGLEQ